MMILVSVLAIEVDGINLRAAVLKRTLHKVTVSNYFKIDRSEESDSISATELSMITTRITNCPKNVVLVSPLVAEIELTMDSKTIKKMRSYQLKEALRWEAEPYIVGSAEETLIGYEIGAATETGQTGIWVSVMPEDEYQEIKKLFDSRGLNLKEIYPIDACFPLAAILGDRKKNKLVINLGQETVKMALLDNGNITALRTLMLSMEALRGHLDGIPDPEVQTTRIEIMEVFNNWTAFDRMIDVERSVILTGLGAADAEFIKFFKESLDIEELTIFQGTAGEDYTPEFATVIGAGLRQIYRGRKWKTIGIDDHIELSRRIRERGEIFPLVSAAVIFLLFLGHFFLMQQQIKEAEKQVAVFSQQREKQESALQKYTELKQELDELNKEYAVLSDKLVFFATGAEEDGKTMVEFLTAVKKKAPADLSISEIYPLEDEGYWTLNGNSLSVASILGMAVNLQTDNCCSYVRVENISRCIKNEKVENEENEIKEVETTSYDFCLSIILENEGGSAAEQKEM